MKVTYRTLDNGRFAVVEATDCGPGPHDAAVRKMPSGSFGHHAFWSGEEDVELDRYGTDGDGFPAAVKVIAYGEVEIEVKLDGTPKTANPPKKIDGDGVTEIPNFTQVENRPNANPSDAPLPYPGYDEATVRDIKDAVDGAGPDVDLPAWRSYEAANKNRKGVLDAIDAKAEAIREVVEPGDTDGNATVIDSTDPDNDDATKAGQQTEVDPDSLDDKALAEEHRKAANDPKKGK